MPDPQDLAIDRYGAVHVLDAANARIVIIDRSGRWQRIQNLRRTVLGSGSGPDGGIAVDPQDNTYVADYGGGHIVRLAENGTVQYRWEHASPATALGMPRGITLDRAGNLLVTDQAKARVEMFSPGGQFEDSWQVPAQGTLQPYPAAIATGGKGRVVVTDSLAGSVASFNEGSVTVSVWKHSGAPPLRAPLAIALTPDAHVAYVADTGNGTVQERTASGVLRRVIALPRAAHDSIPAPSGLAVDAAGKTLYVVDAASRKIEVFSL